MFKKIIPYAHELLENSIKPGEIVIDGTCGNGKDTLFLSKLVGNHGKVLAFDIQQQAITNTRNLLIAQNINNVELIHDGHQCIDNYLDEEHKEQVGGAIFNLGYLPGSDKKIITTPNKTIKAIDTIMKYIKPDGLIVLVVYHGHTGGDIEKEKLLQHLRNFDQKKYQVLQYGFINQRNNPPFVLAIEKA
ncbi:class I SAM-dependent methyltransferase [Aquibacillus albus]|uniref:Methyltransferase n=1 Tax=Aquibacillus albus TaxID=1168171 RepID=A0ABS2MYE6_9BACI|nr:class I SAM-dependent methyltransferase [Aquibacillus albus]MBM7570895.1 putative methyltransferase [Aquibacillus albus]